MHIVTFTPNLTTPTLKSLTTKQQITCSNHKLMDQPLPLSPTVDGDVAQQSTNLPTIYYKQKT